MMGSRVKVLQLLMTLGRTYEVVPSLTFDRTFLYEKHAIYGSFLRN